jgi:integrase
MPSVHRDPRSPKGVWYCYFTRADGTRSARSTGKHNRSQAQIVCQAIEQAEDELARGELSRDRLTVLFNETLTRLGESPLERIAVGTWLDHWVDSKPNLAAHSLRVYRQSVALFKEFLGPKGVQRPLESINERDIHAFAAKLRAEGRSACSVANIVKRWLGGAFESARRKGKIRFNPVAATELERYESAVRDTFSPAQVAHLVETAGRSSDWAGAILFGWSCGARLGDTVRLRWSNLDTEHGVVVFKQKKTRAQTIVGLHPDFVDWLTLQAVPEDPQAYVFPTLADTPLGGTYGLSIAFSQLITAAGIQNRLIRQGGTGKGRSLRGLSFHSLRHTAATQVFNSSVHKDVTRRVTGHADDRILDRYIHADLEAIKAATQLIPRLPRTIDG